MDRNRDRVAPWVLLWVLASSIVAGVVWARWIIDVPAEGVYRMYTEGAGHTSQAWIQLTDGLIVAVVAAVVQVVLVVLFAPAVSRLLGGRVPGIPGSAHAVGVGGGESGFGPKEPPVD